MRQMKMWLYPKPIREIQYSKPYCVDFQPFLRALETVEGVGDGGQQR